MKDKNILIAFLLNIFFSIIEFIGGAITNSVAIMSDAVHDLGDASSIGLSYLLERKSKKKPNEKYTYGYLRYSVLGAFITTMILFIGSLLVIYNAILRILNPVEINNNGMMIFAIFGVIINILAAYVTHDSDSLNEKSVNLHMLEDVLGWIVVLIGSIVIKFTSITIIDPIMSIGVAIFILYNAFQNLKEIIEIFLVKIPDGVDVDHLKEHIKEIKGVEDIHHIHIWTMDGISNYATVHIKVDKYDSKIKQEIKEIFEEHNVNHSTIEFELKEEHCEEDECKIEVNKELHHHHHHHHHHE